MAAVLASGIALAAEPTAQKRDLGQQTIHLESSSAGVDYKTQTAEYKDIVIRDDDIKVQADRAHAAGLNMDNTQWTFEGNVRVQSEQRGSLHSDQAVVEFRNNRIAKVTVDGSPAEFEQKRADSDLMTHGHAGEIVYDVTDGTVRLSKDAWLSDGRNEISSELLVYDMRAQKVQGSAPAGTDGRVHITISPGGKIEPKSQP
jgi:lipopolysaccharide transport protein LptA